MWFLLFLVLEVAGVVFILILIVVLVALWCCLALECGVWIGLTD